MYILWILFSIFAIIYFAIRYHFRSVVWCRSQTCLVGKTALITGANTGIGYETALDFAKRGARVILACRDQSRAEAAKDRIIEETGNENVVVKLVDLGSFTSVRALAQNINENESRLDILVNNAGVAMTGEGKSEDGLLWIMQVNYFSAFLLTNLLLGKLMDSAPSRIINVSSEAAKAAKFDVNNLNTSTGHTNNYFRSKVCNILFTIELAEKLKGTNVTTYVLNPGAVSTEIVRHVSGLLKLAVEFHKRNFMKTCEEGAQTTIYTAVAKDIEHCSGQMFDNCKPVVQYKTVRVPGLSKKLWEVSMELVGLKTKEREIYFFLH